MAKLSSFLNFFDGLYKTEAKLQFLVKYTVKIELVKPTW